MSEEEFLDAIYENQGLIHKICKIYGDSKEDREDLFQEITYQLWKAFPKFLGRSKFTTWMYRIALNTALATFRRPQIKTTTMAKLPETYRQEHVENSQRDSLFKAIRQLKDTEKAIVSMYLDGFDNAAMADVMGINKNHLGVKLHRIKNKLKTILNL